jgi:hypothetical protein
VGKHALFFVLLVVFFDLKEHHAPGFIDNENNDTEFYQFPNYPAHDLTPEHHHQLDKSFDLPTIGASLKLSRVEPGELHPVGKRSELP